MNEKKKEVRDKVFLVTGGAMGMGRLVAERFASDGARVVIWDINQEELDKTTRQMTEKGREVYSYALDVSDRAKVYETAEKVKKEVGAVDVLMNNAGIVRGGPFLEVDDEAHSKTMDINFNAYMWTTKAFLPDMIERGGGHIINIASAAGLTHVPQVATYCASKAAVVNFSNSMRLEMKTLGHKNVRFTLICPTYVSTGMFEGSKPPLIAPWISPEKMADKIYMGYHHDRNLIAAPLLANFIPLMKGIFPPSVVDFLETVLGISRSMQGWQGH
jgi:all-trans-retinol dehydrogenase (NAD+)